MLCRRPVCIWALVGDFIALWWLWLHPLVCVVSGGGGVLLLSPLSAAAAKPAPKPAAAAKASAPAPAKKPAGGKKEVKQTFHQKHAHLFSSDKRDFRIGRDIPPVRDLTRFVKWPRNVRLQRQRSILKRRLKVPPTVNHFTKTLDANQGA
jgi:hypothetical protein